MRAYHRVDPLMDERKGHYTPAQFGAFLKVQLLSGRQMQRGRFRSLEAVRALLPASYVRHVDFLLAQGDLVVQDDGTVYVDGYDEWQEGDLTVKDRMARLRNRRRNEAVTSYVTSTVTEAYPTANAHAIANVTSSEEGGPGGEPDAEPEFPALQWLAQHGCYIRPGNGYHQKLVLVVENYGIGAVLAQLERLAAAGVKRGDDKGYIFGAIDALNAASRPDPRRVAAEERAEERSRSADARIWAQRIRNYKTTGIWEDAWGPVPEPVA